jgi:hypothetical protein
MPPDAEPWDVPMSYPDLLAAMRTQLPLHHDFDGVPWCDEDEPDANNTTWLWQGVGNKIQIDLGGDQHSSGITITRDRGGQQKCVPWPRPKPPELSTAGAASVIGLWFEPGAVAFSTGSDKLYVADWVGKPATYVLSMSALTKIPPRLDNSIDYDDAIVVNNKLKLGYVLAKDGTGQMRVFNTDTDTVVSTTERRSCRAQVLAVDETSGWVYGGGQSDAGECLVKYDSAGHIIAEKDVAPPTGNQVAVIQRVAADSASGDVIYTDPASVARADQTLTEKWRTPAPGASDLGYEPASATVYVCLSSTARNAPATIAVYDGYTGSRSGQIAVPASTDQFAADQQGRLFVALSESNDIYVLERGAQSLTKFETLPSVGDGSARHLEWLAVDPVGHRLFVAPGGGNAIYQYSY